MFSRSSAVKSSRLTCRIDFPGAISCTITRGVSKMTSGTVMNSWLSAWSSAFRMFSASSVKSSSGSIASKRTPSIDSTSMTALKSGARLATCLDILRSSAMSSSITGRTPGRWIFTTAGRPLASRTR